MNIVLRAKQPTKHDLMDCSSPIQMPFVKVLLQNKGYERLLPPQQAEVHRLACSCSDASALRMILAVRSSINGQAGLPDREVEELLRLSVERPDTVSLLIEHHKEAEVQSWDRPRKEKDGYYLMHKAATGKGPGCAETIRLLWQHGVEVSR